MSAFKRLLFSSISACVVTWHFIKKNTIFKVVGVYTACMMHVFRIVYVVEYQTV